MPPTTDEAYAELINRAKESGLLGSCSAVLGWDERTNLPRRGAGLRGDQMALLARLMHEMTTSPVIGELLATLSEKPLPSDDPRAANVRELKRAYERACKLPTALVTEMARVAAQAQQAWQQARKDNDFPAFRPYLEHIVMLKREEAKAVGYSDHPYDALLDEYEPGARTAEIRTVFTGLAHELVPLIGAIAQSSRKPRTEILHREFPIDRQKLFAEAAAAAIGFDFHAGRLDVTTHPFCSGIGPGDVRLATRYNPRFFNEAFFGVLHEAGHGIYEQGLDPEHAFTPLGYAASLGIHESQSRLWENQVGRSRPFWEHFFPRLRQAFPGTLDDVLLDDLYFAVNEVKPSYIRVEADEATYNLHIILRFELEQALLTGDLAVADLQGAWNDKFRRLFGLEVPSDSMGCLQDIHWSSGGLGYFPTYTLGNLFAAQFMAQARQDLGEQALDDDFRAGRFDRLKEWLNRLIHRHGQRYRPNELCRRITGKELSPFPLLEYLQAKYGALYGLDGN